MEIQLREHLWLGLTIWTVLYISDYSFTLACARMYRKGVNEKIVFEGSYELTPYYQRDIDSLRKYSPRFLLALLLALATLSTIWFLAGLIQMRELYVFALGALILLQLVIHKRHLSNFFLFRALMKTDAARGRIEYSRPLILRQSSFELFTFSAIFVILALFTWSLFLLGGALGCASTAAKHWQLAQGAAAAHPSSAQAIRPSANEIDSSPCDT